MNRNARIATHILTYSLAAFVIATGLDKALQLERLTDWTLLLGPVSNTLLPFGAEIAVRIQGCIEVLIGALIIFSPWKRAAVGLFIVSALFVIIDLASQRFYVLIISNVIVIAAAISLLVLISPERNNS